MRRNRSLNPGGRGIARAFRPELGRAAPEGTGNAADRKGLKLFWFSTGVDDRLIPTTRATVEMLKKHGFEPVYKESPGAHTWIN